MEGHDHGHGDGHGHHEGHEGHEGHEHRDGLVGFVRGLVAPHSHDAADRFDGVADTTAEGISTLRLSLVLLGITAIAQLGVVAFTGSVALLGDTVHNLADAGTALPIWLAFRAGRRPATRTYTHGLGRAEDLAGLAVVVVILASALFAGWESIDRLLDPRPVRHLWAVGLAGAVGFLGNEVVARLRIRTGRRIGSAALVADGLHARTDGFTSLAVVGGAAGVALGWEQADPVVGLLITAAILGVARSAARDVLRRLLDGVDPDTLDRVEQILAATPGVLAVTGVRLRWVGHELRAEATLEVAADASLATAHAVSEAAEHALVHQVPRLVSATIHVDPAGHDHPEVGHHAPEVPAAEQP